MSDAAAGDAGEVTTELNRDIGLLGALAIGIGTMMAAGIFVLSGLAVSKVGVIAILSFAIAAVVAAFTAAAYAEFSSIYPESGGGYMYVANTFKQNFTYIMGWTMILGYPASAAFYLASFSDWFYRFIYPLVGIPQAIPYWLPGVAVLALLVFINIRGSEESSQFQIVVTTLKVVLVGFFLYGGLQAFNTDIVATSAAENVGQFAEIGVTSALVFITFFGFSAIATDADCDVLVERLGDDAAGDVESVLLPTAGGPHAELSREIGRAICRATGARAEVLRVVPPDGDVDDAREQAEESAAELRAAEVAVETTVVESDDVLDAITDRTSEHDLTVVGSTREGLLQQFVFGAIPEEVARAADDTVVIAKRNEGLSSQARYSLRRWLQ
ncbi:UspA domain-containing protein [Halococcus thailandensis JCM 13552]|uniref:UspA domain-containing protein n=2 Tax=Halococcus thailandensis TaxID=335952 RepID=M0MY91_9EURY|nr:UspA domain-containing protein [Halococcus thailandensis JCM 13552]